MDVSFPSDFLFLFFILVFINFGCSEQDAPAANPPPAAPAASTRSKADIPDFFKTDSSQPSMTHDSL